MAARKTATKTASSRASQRADHPLLGRGVRAYGAEDNSLLGPKGEIVAVFTTACSEVGNVAMVRLDNGGTTLLPLSRLVSQSDIWMWIVE